MSNKKSQKRLPMVVRKKRTKKEMIRMIKMKKVNDLVIYLITFGLLIAVSN